MTSDLFDAVGLSLQDYLLRQIGWQVERVLADLLARTGRPMIPRIRRVDFCPRMPIWMLFREPAAGGTEVAVSVNVNSDDLRPVAVMRYSWHGKTHHIFHDGGDPKVGGVRIRLVIDDPVTGSQTTTAGSSQPSGWKPECWGA